jgi:hypothetical protein
MSRYIIRAELAKTEKRAAEIQEAIMLFLVKTGVVPESELPVDALKTLEYRALLFKQS